MHTTTTTAYVPPMHTPTDAVSLSDVVALWDSDQPGCRIEALRLARSAGLRDEFGAVLDERKVSDQIGRAVDAAIRDFEGRQRLSTPWLEDEADSPAPTARRARILLQLPTVEARREALAGMHRFLNATPDAGRPSDALLVVVNGMLAGFPA